MAEHSHHDHHDHSHDDHAPIHADGPKPEYALLERAVRELLIGKGVFAADDMRKQIDLMDTRSPAHKWLRGHLSGTTSETFAKTGILR